jgi:hypothetical protein
MKHGLLAVALAFFSATAGAQNVKYVSGGIGDDSAAQMAAVGREFNLKLLFAAKDGHYLSDVSVAIVDAANRKVLDVVSDGPFLYAQLPAGKYTVSANYAGAAQSRSTSLAASGRRELVFRWEEAAESAATADGR